MNLAIVIMAAGMGTRMKSRTPKVLHPVLGKPMLGHVLDAVRPLNPVEAVVIVGHEADRVQAAFGDEASFVEQSPQLGTGHAVKQAKPLLAGKVDAVLVVPGDLPLLTTQTFQSLVDLNRSTQGHLAMLTVERSDPWGFGRIVRDEHGFVQAVVEEAACTPEQKAIRELNVGVYAFEADWLWENLEMIPLSAKGEYYVTDLVGIAVAQGEQIQAELLADPVEALGVNNRVHLAHIETELRRNVNQKWMESGVTMIDPATTYIELEVTIERDTVIYPGSHLLGKTMIGCDCVIGPNTFIKDSAIGDGCAVRFSVVEQAVVDNGAEIGPFHYSG